MLTAIAKKLRSLIEEDTTLKGDKVGKTLRIDRRSET
jgi:hypothetical protein